MGPELELLLPELDERARRLVLGAVARAAGDGGTGAVAKMAGASWQTVANGAEELASGLVAPQGRVRRPGAGRKPLSETDPGLVPALLALVEDSSRGDPGSPLMWTAKSAKNLAGELAARGHACSPQTAWRLLREQGFSTQANAKVTEGRRHPDRDGQFRYIAAQAREHLAAGQPVISVDAKKKEQVGEYAQAGREWRRPSLSNLLCELRQLLSVCYLRVGGFLVSGQTGTRSPNVTANAFMAAFQPYVPVPRSPLSRTSPSPSICRPVIFRIPR
jgi:hypothetical protein